MTRASFIPQIRPFASSDSIEELTALLHRAYKQLADIGLRFLATHQDANTTRNRVEAGDCFVAEINGRIIATITFYMPGKSYGSPWLDRPDVGHIGQLAVEPEYQGHGIASRLMHFIEDHARRRGVAELALDTSEKATHLISWYERQGYKFIEHAQWNITNYRSVVMSKTL